MLHSGDDDYTDRFYKKNSKYFWKNGLELTFFINVDDLAELVYSNIDFDKSRVINPCK